MYVAGQTTNNNYVQPCYWKNGVINILPSQNLSVYTGDSKANSIFISGPDIYVAGTVSNNAVYWINGNFNKLNGIYANSIYVNNKDVYVGGATWGQTQTARATYWKNGIMFYQLDGRADKSMINSTFYFNSKVYSCGNCNYFHAYYCVDTSFHNSLQDGLAAGANSIYVVSK